MRKKPRNTHLSSFTKLSYLALDREKRAPLVTVTTRAASDLFRRGRSSPKTSSDTKEWSAERWEGGGCGGGGNRIPVRTKEPMWFVASTYSIPSFVSAGVPSVTRKTPALRRRMSILSLEGRRFLKDCG